MNKIVLPALAIAALAALGGYAVTNHAGAQGAAPAQVPGDAPPAGPADGWAHNRPGGWDDHPRGGWGQHRWLASRERFGRAPFRHAHGWGLFFPQADKKLTAADVQTIAEAILLRHGNHSWKVINVVQNQDDTVSFAFATQSGEIIARFAMDTHTGRLRRIG